MPWNPTHYKNYSTGVLSGTHSISTSNIYFAANETGNFPDLPFNLAVYNYTDYPAAYNDPEFEIVRATGVLSNGFSVIRGFSTTTGSSKSISSKTYVAHQSIDASLFNEQYRYFRPIDYGMYVNEEFNWVSGGHPNWLINSSNSNTSITGYSRNPGVLNFSINSSNQSYSILRTINSGSIQSGITELSFYLKLSENGILSDNYFRYHIGLTDSTGVSAASNGVYFEINSSGSNFTGISMVICSGGVFNSGITYFTDNNSKSLQGFTEYKIKINSVRDIANFYINNVEASGSPVSGGLPLKNNHFLLPIYKVNKTYGVQTLNSFIDYLELKQIFEKKNRY